jgi:Uma2 family endonuclease
MASSTTHLSLQQYHEKYASKPGCEYWFGEVVRKAVPTWLHALLQGLLVELFVRAGYAAGSELELRIDPDWEPRPDVVASLTIEEPYPTKPVAIVAEVLSPDDRMDALFEKCAHYARIGIRQILVFNPRTHTAWEWNTATENLERIDRLKLENGEVVDLAGLWNELERRRRIGRAER